MAIGKDRLHFGFALLVAAVCAAATISVYAPSLRAGFYFDDQPNIVEVEALHWTSASLAGVSAVLRDGRAARRPIANLSFALNHLYAGLDPTGYHLVNLLIHLAAGAALAWVAHLGVRNGAPGPVSALPAIFAAALFLLHPLNTQAVTYVVQRMSSLAALFSLLCLGCYFCARQRQGTPRALYLGASGVCLLLSCGSKETGLALPFVLGLYELCFHRRGWIERGRAAWASRTPLGALTAVCAVSIAAWIAWTLIEASALSRHFGWSEIFPGRTFSGSQRVMTQPRVLFFYLSLLVWPSPSRLSLEHDFPLSLSLTEPWTTGLAIASWLGIAALGVGLARSRPRYGFPLLAFLAFCAIESGPINLELVFEHRMYLPMAALALLGSVLAADLPPRRRLVAGVAAALLAVPLAVATRERNELWADRLAFHRDCALKAPGKFRPAFNYATRLGHAGHYAQALEELQRAAGLRVENPVTLHVQLGAANAALGRYAEALAELQRAVQLEPRHPEALFNLAQLLDRRGESSRAIPHYRVFLEVAPRRLATEARWVRARLASLPGS